MKIFEQENSRVLDTGALTPRLLEEFFGHEKASKPDKAGSGAQQENSLSEGIKMGFHYLDRMPDGSEFDPGLAIWVHERLTGTELPGPVKTLLDGVTSFNKHGNRVKITRDGEVSLDLNQELLGGKIKIESLNFGNTGFDLSGDAESPHLKNI